MDAAPTALLSSAAALVEPALEHLLPGPDAPPARLHRAMRHAVLGGGKRVRPALVLGACRACGGADAAAVPAMVAVELLHAYTLVHDDLPAMDDDDWRRGRPTVHRAFDEATAILVGDAVQAAAFAALAHAPWPAATVVEALRRLSAAAGSEGVVGGQQEDLDAERQEPPDDPAAAVERIHRRKTAALIAVSCSLGGLAAAANPTQQAALARYGEAVGLAFQIVDDLLDEAGDPVRLGKTPGKDRAAGKLTWPGVHGVAAAQMRAAALRVDAQAALAALPSDGGLGQLAAFIVGRER